MFKFSFVWRGMSKRFSFNWIRLSRKFSSLLYLFGWKIWSTQNFACNSPQRKGKSLLQIMKKTCERIWRNTTIWKILNSSPPNQKFWEIHRRISKKKSLTISKIFGSSQWCLRSATEFYWVYACNQYNDHPVITILVMRSTTNLGSVF